MDREPESIFPAINIVNAPERVVKAIRFIADRLFFDVPSQPNLRELRED